MSSELEEQQRRVYELKEQLQSMEKDEKDLTEKVRILETKVVVQDLQDKIKVKSEAIDQLRFKAKELEGKLRSEKASPAGEQVQIAETQEQKPREFF